MSPTSDHPANQILGPVPTWIRRWVIWVPALLLGLFLLLAWLIRYPDEVEAPCRLSGRQALSPLVAPSSGVLSDFWIADDGLAPKGKWIASLDLPGAESKHFSDLEAFVRQARKRSEPAHICSALDRIRQRPPFLNRAWSALEAACLDWKEVQSGNYLAKRRANLRQQQATVQAALHSLTLQDSILEREVAVAEQQYNRFQKMFEARAVSRLELEQAEQAFLERQRLRKVLDEELHQYAWQKIQLEAELLDLEKNRRDAQRSAYSRVLIQWGDFEQAWEDLLVRQVVRAPVAGRFQPAGMLRAGTYVEAGRELGVIQVTERPDSILATILIAQDERGTIEEGNEVQLLLAGFPEGEYGVLEGKIDQLSNIPVGGFFSAHVLLNLPLQTNFGKEIPFREDMQGQARVITSDKRLLHRLFYRLRTFAQ